MQLQCEGQSSDPQHPREGQVISVSLGLSRERTEEDAPHVRVPTPNTKISSTTRGYCKHNKQGGLLVGFHLNNQLTQSLTSRYRDSRLRVDFERFVCCAARLTCIFREYSRQAG